MISALFLGIPAVVMAAGIGIACIQFAGQYSMVFLVIGAVTVILTAVSIILACKAVKEKIWLLLLPLFAMFVILSLICILREQITNTICLMWQPIGPGGMVDNITR